MEPSISKSSFGAIPGGGAVELYTLTNADGLVCKAITYGAAVTELHVPDRAGRLGDIVLGFDNLPQYLTDSPCFGSVVGRVANRIAGGRFSLDGRSYSLAINDPPNTLHGGTKGFDKVVWGAEGVNSPDGPSVVFQRVSPDMEEGFPGALSARVAYTLTNGNELRIDYEASSDKATPVNLSHHSYFNLAGKGDVLGHVLQLKAARFTPIDSSLVPTGEIARVADGPLDFTKPKAIGRDIARMPSELHGYDHNLVLDGGGPGPVLAARVHEPVTGRAMEVSTDQPGLQFYTGNSLPDGLAGKRGARYARHSGFCLETQHFPDSVNRPAFPTTILRPGQVFRSTTIYRFAAK